MQISEATPRYLEPSLDAHQAERDIPVPDQKTGERSLKELCLSLLRGGAAAQGVSIRAHQGEGSQKFQELEGQAFTWWTRGPG